MARVLRKVTPLSALGTKDVVCEKPYCQVPVPDGVRLKYVTPQPARTVILR